MTKGKRKVSLIVVAASLISFLKEDLCLKLLLKGFDGCDVSASQEGGCKLVLPLRIRKSEGSGKLQCISL